MCVREEDNRDKVLFFQSHQEKILSIQFVTVGIDLVHLDDVEFLRLLYYKVPFPPSILHSLERSHYAQPTLVELEFMFHLLEEEYVAKLFGILLYR